MPTNRSRLRPPTRNDWVVSRPRLTDRLTGLLGDFRLVWVLGTAGSGKTTAVADALGAADRPVVWLTLDDAEAAPGRLLVHLQDALAEHVPGVDGVATRALASELPHVEVAGLVADAVGSRERVIVLDEVEHLSPAPAARRVLSAFLRGLAPPVRVVLVSRREVPLQLGSALGVGGVGRLGETELAFEVPEAAGVLDGLRRPPSSAEDAVTQTGGWVAGVLFEAWRSPEHTPGAGGEADALTGYMATEIMNGLSPAERWFLLATSLLRDVTAPRAAALGLPHAQRTLTALRRLHVPVSFSAGGTEMRCHPRFREFLRRSLDEQEEGEVRALHAAHGRELLREGDTEDAVAAFLLAGSVDDAERAGERAMPAVLRRGDVAVAARWLGAFRRTTVQRSVVLTRAALAVALESEAWTAGAAAADRLLGMLREEAAREELDPGLAGTIGTCFLHVGRFDDVWAVLSSARPGPAREAWRVALGIDVVDRPEHYRDRPADRGETVDGLLHRYDLMHGRFARLLQVGSEPWAAARSSRIAAFCAVGRFDEALELLDDWSDVERSPAMTRIRVDLLADLGRHDEAFAVLERGRDVAAASSAYCVMMHRLQEAALALRADGDVARAVVCLDRVEEDPTAHRRGRVAEQVLLWRGLAALLGGDAPAARDHLRRGLDLMLAWDRQFFVPAAGVYLAEAEWRLGDEDAADAAADHALSAAGVQGSDHLLLRALQRFPAVASRRIDAETAADSRWHGIGRQLLADGPVNRSAGPAPTLLREFGPPRLQHRGVALDPRLSRSFELLARLAASGGSCAKTTLLDDLFGGGTDDRTRSYLRQAIKRIRDVLPADVRLETEGPDVRWVGGTLRSDAVVLEDAARDVARAHGRERLDAALRAVAPAADGAWFPGSTTAWIADRRRQVAMTVCDLRLEAAESAYAIGELERAREQVALVLTADPFRESAWRLSMRIAAAMGDDDRVIALYRDCRDRLAELPTTPAPSTRRLLDQLRR